MLVLDSRTGQECTAEEIRPTAKKGQNICSLCFMHPGLL